MEQRVEIFTDGACLGNPGPGGYGAIMRCGKHEKNISAGYQLTTNNRMELLAAIMALESLKKGCQVTLTTDSQYLRQGITTWIKSWKIRGWKTTARQPVRNVDLWQRLELACQRHQITWLWVKGHTGHLENELCDQLARSAAEAPTMDDLGYLSS